MKPRSTAPRRPKILAAGMLPPPLGGQALMFETALRGIEGHADVDVIDLQAQRNIGTSGAMSLGKVLRLGEILLHSLRSIARHRHFDTLYYCPSGPSTIGLLKDIALLSVLRPFCKRTIYHFHGTGGIAMLSGMNPAVRALARKAMWQPDLALRCAAVSPDDAALCEAKQPLVVPNGIPDPRQEMGQDYSWSRPEKHVLTFIGAMTAEKGIFELVELARRLRDRGLTFEVHCIGEGTDAEIAQFDKLVADYCLTGSVKRLGILKGREKFEALANSTLFVFPSYFRAETQPLVVIEAFAMGLPVVAYDWRGLSSIIDEGENGFLVETRNIDRLTDVVERALLSEDLAAMSRKARAKYESNFTLERFEQRIREILCPEAEILSGPPVA